MSFGHWREYFERNRVRPMPDLPAIRAPWAAKLARSLAVFQLGESKGGRLATEIDALPGLDDDYKAAIKLFVAEEQRHGDVLAACVGALGGELLKQTWTESLFLVARRLAGVRFKLVVLLAAETCGLAFYRGVCTRLPAGALKDALDEICADEVQHLKFHGDAFRGDRNFRLAYIAVVTAATAVVLVDHRKTHRALGIGISESVQRFREHVAGMARDLARPEEQIHPASDMTAA